MGLWASSFRPTPIQVPQRPGWDALLAGRLIYDLDVSETTEPLDAPIPGLGRLVRQGRGS